MNQNEELEKLHLQRFLQVQADELSGAAGGGYRDFQNIVNDIRKVCVRENSIRSLFVMRFTGLECLQHIVMVQQMNVND
jgi:hypothetical protein